MIVAVSSTSTTTATTFAAVTTTSLTSSTSGVSSHRTWAAASIWIDKSAYQDFFKLPAPSATTESTSIVRRTAFSSTKLMEYNMDRGLLQVPSSSLQLLL
ncbi:unnamed protein product, partial [Mesorhabditis spiculigera]